MFLSEAKYADLKYNQLYKKMKEYIPPDRKTQSVLGKFYEYDTSDNYEFYILLC